MSSQDAYDLVFQTGVSSLELEGSISKDGNCSFRYANNVLKNKFELGEESIGKDSHFSYYYAIHVIRDRFELGEKAISHNCYDSYYAFYALNGRFKLGEGIIMKTMNSNSFDYFINALGYTHG